MLQLERGPEGSWTARAASPDQGFADIPVAGLAVEERRLTLRLPMLGASFSGTLDGETQSLDGVLSAQSAALPLRC